MKKLSRTLTPLSWVVLGLLATLGGAAAVESRTLETAFQGIPLAFEPNVGQFGGQFAGQFGDEFGGDVLFTARGAGYTLSLTATEAVMAVADGGVSRLRWLGAASAPDVRGLRPSEATSAYFLGNDPSRWRRRVPRYAAVEYTEIYPGIDLVFYSGAGGLEYDFVVAPGADPEAIRLQLDGGRPELDPEGNLRLAFEAAEVVHQAPYVFQEVAGERRPVAGAFRRQPNGEIGFEVANWDRGRPLVIDPKIRYSTYFGGTDHDVGFDVARDSAGQLYVLGRTESARLGGVDRERPGTSEIVIARFNKPGKLKRLAFLGGDQGAVPASIAIARVAGPGSPEAVYVSGGAGSGFPTELPIQAECAGPGNPCTFIDATITVLDLDLGEILFSTYLGGTDGDVASLGGSLAVDQLGRIAVVGTTVSKDFPKRQPTQRKRRGLQDGFVSVLEPVAGGGYRLAFSTYLGGRNRQSRTATEGVAFDRHGRLHVAGSTNSKKKFPTVGAIQNKLAGAFDGFLTIYDLGGEGAPPGIAFSTYYGGRGNDQFFGVTVDDAGWTYVTGSTGSSDYPLVNPLDDTLGGPSDALVTVFDAPPAASGGTPEIVTSTLFGGGSQEVSRSLAVDRTGVVHFAGITQSRDLPKRFPVQQQCAAHPTLTPDCADGFVARLGPILAGQAPELRFSTFLGGPGGGSSPGSEILYSVVVDRKRATYVVGVTNSQSFPTKKAGQKRNAGANDMLVVKITK